MKNNIFLTTIEAILFVFFLYLVIINFINNTTSNFYLTLNNTNPITIDTFLLIIFMYFFGVLSGALYSFIIGKRYRDQLEFFARKNEKLAQQSEIDTDDKEALQRKIATLEIALNNALKNKD